MNVKMDDHHKKIVSVICFATFIIFTIVIFWYIGRPMLKFVSQPERFRGWVDAHGIWSRVAFVGMVVLQIIVAIIPGEPLEIGAGYAFGIIEGTLLCMLGAVIGSVLVVLLVRRFGIKLVEVFFSREKIQSLKFMQNTRRLDLLILIVFLIPGTPKDLLCYFVGLTPMKMKSWIFISAIARIPSIITSTIGGDALGVQKYEFAAIVFGITIAISITGILFYRHICKKQRQNDESEKLNPKGNEDNIV